LVCSRSNKTGYRYGFTVVRRKIDWRRASPKVCVEVDEVSGRFQRMSVIVTARHQESPSTAEVRADRLHAQNVVEKRMLC